MTTSISRRDLFKFGGLAAAGAASASVLGGCAQPNVASSNQEGDQGEQTKASTWRIAPEPVTDFAETIDCDLVVVGAGNGGLVAAMTAQEKGFNVMVLEKGGAIAAAREAIGTIGSRHSLDHAPDIPELINHARLTQGGDIDARLYYTWAEKSGEYMDWLEDIETPAGMVFPFEYHAPEDEHAYYPAMCTNPVMGEYNPEGPNYGGYVHLEVLRDLFLEAGGTIEFLTPACQLVQADDGTVTGVVANSSDGYKLYNAAKGVILCTGGYGANQEMIEELCPETMAYCTNSAATTEEGDGIRMALWAGGVLEKGRGAMVWNRGVVLDDEKLGPEMASPLFLPNSQPFLRVNVEGKRFMNEDSTYPEAFSAGTRQPKGFYWVVFDGNYWENIQKFDTCGCSRLAPAPSGSAFNADVYSLEACSKENLDEFWIEPALEGGYLKKCDTIEELASTMFSDSGAQASFLETVTRYNQMMEEGDTDFGKSAYRCSTVSEKPFYAVRAAGNFLVTINGILTDTNSQVVREDGSVIPGLYVCGNDQGGFYPHNYPSEFTGINAGRTGTFARIAAKHACGIE